MRASTKRIAFMSTLAALFIGALAVAFWPAAVPVDLDTVDRGSVVVTADSEAQARVRQVYVVSAPLSGRLARVNLQAGDAVEARSTVLASIEEVDPGFLDARSRAELEARVHAAEAAMALARAEVNQAQAQLEFATEEWQRQQALHNRGATTTRALEEARLAARTADARVDTTQAALRMRLFELEIARAALIEPGSNDAIASPRCCVAVRAPVDGEVLNVMQESETVVQAGTPLMEIGDPNDLEVIADLPSRDAVRVRVGAPVVIDGWGGDPLAASVRRVEPSAFTKISALGVEEQRVNVLMDFVDRPNENGADRPRLGHGYRVMARITIDRADDALRVPIGALFREQGRWAVFVLENGRAHRVFPEIGLIDDRYAELRSGLTEGTTVILHPSDRVEDGVRVEARDAG